MFGLLSGRHKKILKNTLYATCYTLLGAWSPPLPGTDSRLKLFFSAGAGAVWQNGRYRFTYENGNSSTTYAFPNADTRFLSTATTGLLLASGHLRLGPYVDISYTPPSGNDGGLSVAMNNGSSDIITTEHPIIRWTVGFELGWQWERINPFVRAGHTYTRLQHVFCNYQDQKLIRNCHMEGMTTGFGLNYAVTPSLFFGTSIEVRFLLPCHHKRINEQSANGLRGAASLRTDDLAFLVNARYVLDLKRRRA